MAKTHPDALAVIGVNAAYRDGSLLNTSANSGTSKCHLIGAASSSRPLTAVSSVEKKQACNQKGKSDKAKNNEHPATSSALANFYNYVSDDEEIDEIAFLCRKPVAGSSLAAKSPCPAGRNRQRLAATQQMDSPEIMMEIRTKTFVPAGVSPARKYRYKKRTCVVCTDEKGLYAYYNLSNCSHSFCKQCLQTSIAVQMEQSSAKSIKCLDFECKQFICYDDVRRLLDAKVFAKYDALLRESNIAAMKDVEICPSKTCGLQYIIAGNVERNVSVCPNCEQMICRRCSEIIAKPLPPGGHFCALPSERLEQVLTEYENPSTTSAAREALELTYGKQKLQAMLGDRLSEREVKNSKKCPACAAPCYKLSGCNKMTCRCGALWCWLCGVKINPAVNYQHFAAYGGSCILHNV